jgi:hypothetical protein
MTTTTTAYGESMIAHGRLKLDPIRLPHQTSGEATIASDATINDRAIKLALT